MDDGGEATAAEPERTGLSPSVWGDVIRDFEKDLVGEREEGRHRKILSAGQRVSACVLRRQKSNLRVGSRWETDQSSEVASGREKGAKQSRLAQPAPVAVTRVRSKFYARSASTGPPAQLGLRRFPEVSVEGAGGEKSGRGWGRKTRGDSGSFALSLLKKGARMTTPTTPIPARLSLTVADTKHLGTILYRGPIPSTKGEWYGVEWDEPSRGRHDGVHDATGVRYFTCRYARRVRLWANAAGTRADPPRQRQGRWDLPPPDRARTLPRNLLPSCSPRQVLSDTGSFCCAQCRQSGRSGCQHLLRDGVQLRDRSYLPR